MSKLKIDIKELKDVIVELTEMDVFIKERYQEIDETIFIGTDKDEEIIAKVSGNFEVKSIEYLNKQEINPQKVIDAINPIIPSVIKISARVKPVFFIFTRLSLLVYNVL